MSFLDKVTKAVGDVVDKGKKDVDQFLKIQKINGEISAFERKIEGLQGQIAEVTKLAGAKAIELVRSGAVASPELRAFADQVAGIDRQVAAEQSNIVAKREEIERVKAEHEAAHAAAATPSEPPAPVTPPMMPPPIPGVPAPAAAAPPPPEAHAQAAPPVPEPASAQRFCTECGATLTGGAFCSQCGAKLG